MWGNRENVELRISINVLYHRCGEIESIRVLHERFCAFVNFKNANMAARALERLQVSDGMKHNAV